MKTKYEWTGDGPQLQQETLSDGSTVYNVIISEETVFCLDARHALQLIEDLNEAALKAMSDKCQQCGCDNTLEKHCVHYNQDAASSLAAPSGSGAEVQKALLISGQLAGMCFDFYADALERWLNSKPKDFRYETWCRAAIAFKRAIALPPNDEVSEVAGRKE